MNWEASGESPIVYVTVEVAVVGAGDKAEPIMGSPFTYVAHRPQTRWPGPGPTRLAPVRLASSTRGRPRRRRTRRERHDARRRDEIDLLIVDDNRAARYSVWALLSWKRDMRVTGTASSSAEGADDRQATPAGRVLDLGHARRG